MSDSPRAYSPWEEGRARQIAVSLKDIPGACLPILHAIQEEFGYIPADAVPIVANVLNLSKAEVVGVVSFYADFRQEPPARHVVKVCLAESCQAMGSAAVVSELEAALGVTVGQATPDRAFEIEPVYCLGNCALSPALVIDGRPLGRMTPERATALVTERRP